jgi:hypothetical protein
VNISKGKRMPLHRELRQAIESGFLPLQCQCAVAPDGAIVITIAHAETGDVELCVTGVCAAALTSSRQVAALISELRAELQMTRTTIERPKSQTLSHLKH